jgi:hypothetical protein
LIRENFEERFVEEEIDEMGSDNLHDVHTFLESRKMNSGLKTKMITALWKNKKIDTELMKDSKKLSRGKTSANDN